MPFYFTRKKFTMDTVTISVRIRTYDAFLYVLWQSIITIDRR
jgi:hypothetical protein